MNSNPVPPSAAAASRADWRTIGLLLPYLLEFKGRVILAMSLLVVA